jgi:rhamnose utilization protein RhaD (predicted bifunctional aldolase and dehydrogenase)/NAD(P)-dependent dehydrogenase (short-subunit alcohol dehydrogenase family)
MKNQWLDRAAKAMIKHYATQGVNVDVALRVYTSRLLGNDPQLVLHGGGNTSVKTVMTDTMGDAVDVLCVKGSGWDMGDIEPAGLPAVRLGPLQRMSSLKKLSDEDMVNAQRTNLLDSTAPNPSVETLLHAFLPHKFIDHTHSNAVLALTDQPNGDALCRETFGPKFGYVPYIMPGFDLSKKALEVFNEDPDVEGLILLKHGIFTFGKTADQAYGRMIRAVTKAETKIRKGATRSFHAVTLPDRIAGVASVAPILRGLTSHDGKPMVLDFRTDSAIRSFVSARGLSRFAHQGTATPDHVIRTKAVPLIVPAPEPDNLDGFAEKSETALEKYVADYHAYFKRNNAKSKVKKTMLDPMPRLIAVPGLGIFGLGNSAKAAGIAADLFETNIQVITNAESMSRYQVIAEKDIFEIEYWSLEQAKLGKGGEKPLQRKIVMVTGAGSGIGAATARAFADQGACVAVLDRNTRAAQSVAGSIGGLAVDCDVTNPTSVRQAFDVVVGNFGGVDIVVSNAGAAWDGRIGEVSHAKLRKSFDLNFWAHQYVSQNAVRVMQAQGTGGCLLYNTSKQAINPGKDFGPYGLPKAATLFLMRQYAVDYGEDGIRSNAVNADRIRSGLLTDDMIKTRSKARDLSEDDYMSGNLLGTEVTAEHVAQAFVDLAKAESTTAAVITVDGGNIAAALR